MTLNFGTSSREAIEKSDLLDVNAFYRGSPELVEKIFVEGFISPGPSLNITEHLLFSPNSSFVSITADRNQAMNHAFNQTSDAGFIYRIKPSTGMEGVWVPGWKRGDPSANRNQELEVVNYVLPWLIHGAWVFHKSNGRKVNRLYEGGPWLENQEEEDCTEGEAGCGGEDDAEDDRSAQPLVPAEVFLDWFNSTKEAKEETAPGIEKVFELFDSILAGELTYQDAILGFKQAYSTAVKKRLAAITGPFTGDGSEDEMVEALEKTANDVLGSLETGVAQEHVIEIFTELGPIARQIEKAQTPEEKHKIANKDIHPLVEVWSYSVLGQYMEVLMLNAAHDVPFAMGPVMHLNNMWSYTPFGLLVNKLFPIRDLLKRGVPGQQKSVDYAITQLDRTSPESVGHTVIRIGPPRG
ncbi:hypothetical protein CP532_0511 [Ophiocordyceps camponoti-leonardi (nom. inval.)]|nr:hypothetical protein CP532_0511 [Ophiocordyceps camponoti-leonardi (nom. inval.)]